MRQERHMRCPIHLCLLCLGGLFAFAAGCEKAAARAEPPPPKVSVAHPEVREVIDYDQYNGWMDGADTVEVRARVKGHIQKIYFTDGRLGKKGDLLIELDPRPFESAIARQHDQTQIFQSQMVA